MSEVWSGLTTKIVKTKRTNLPKRTLDVVAVVVHTTGSGIVAKALKKSLDPQEYAAKYYAGKRSFSSHYLVGHDFSRDDAIIGTVPENLVSYHSGMNKHRRAIYKKGKSVWPRYKKVDGAFVDGGKHLPHYEDWLDRWPNLDSPNDLIPGTSINYRTIGVDFLAPEPGEKHSELQTRWVASLISDILERTGLKIERKTVLRHSDVDPLTRSTRRGGWDPPAYVFRNLCDLLGIDDEGLIS